MRTRSLATLIGIIALVAACSPGPGAGGTLEGTEWVLRSYLQAGELVLVPETEYADAEFRSSRVTGFGGCNSFKAAYRTGGRTLLITDPSSTLMACAESSMTFEQTYLQLLGSSRFYTVQRNTLTINDGVGSTVLVFDAAPRNALLGPWRVDSFETAPSTVSALLPGTEIDVTFGIGNVGGFAGCNSFSGTYGTNGNIVRIGQLATTRLACAEDVMAQETAFLEALQGVALIDPRRDQVNLTDLNGILVVALLRPADAAAEASPSPGASAPAVASPRPSLSPSPSPAPTPAPTPTPVVTAPPTATPAPTPQPTPPPSPPPTAARCQLDTTDGTQVATIAYPGSWFTVTTPANLACQYFDPAPITVPADPATLTTAIQSSVTATPFADAVTAATDPAAWTVVSQENLTLDNLAATLVEATATTDANGVPVGISRFAYLIDVGSAGTITLWTTGTVDGADFESNSAIVSLMAEFSDFVAAS
jgi:heat shock protein HslJ